MSRHLDERRAGEEHAWRDPAEIVAEWSDGGEADAGLLAVKARGEWWDILASAGVTLMVSREYEHLVLAISSGPGPRVSYLRIPHPSGIAFDPVRNRLNIASTRNPTRIIEFGRVSRLLPRGDVTRRSVSAAGVLVPTRSWYLPGCLYLHDMVMIAGRLHGNAVGQNVVVDLAEGGSKMVWWPRSVERDGLPRVDRNYLQLNSIAAGRDLATSFFTASTERPGRYRPGHRNYPVDRRGVIYSGATREPLVRGLTRPHSARLHEDRVWVDDSGYGELGFAAGERFEPVARLPGWTRGLAFAGDFAFVGTSRMLPKFAHYAPGLDVDRCLCAIHAVDTRTGVVRGSLEFPYGNQIFAIEAVPAAWSTGFPFRSGVRPQAARGLFYAYSTDE